MYTSLKFHDMVIKIAIELQIWVQLKFTLESNRLLLQDCAINADGTLRRKALTIWLGLSAMARSLQSYPVV